MRAMLVVNPMSGRGVGGRVAGGVAAALRRVADPLDVHIATSADDTAAAARRAVDDGVDVLAMLGGDGTMALALAPCAASGTTLAVIPSGTGNDLAAWLGLPTAPLAAAAAVATAIGVGLRDGVTTRAIDLGRIGPASTDPGQGERWFSTVLCAGFDSKVNERANRMRWPKGPRRYDLAILGELARLRPYPLVVETEHGTHHLDATMVSVGNTPSYGGGLKITPGADLADGLFDVTIVGPLSRRRLVGVFPKLRSGGHVDEPEVQTLRARRVRLAGDNDWVAYADGDRQGTLPIIAECVPGAIRVVTAPTAIV